MNPIVELAYNAVIAMITEHRLTELPSERILASKIGVSRGSIRTALKQLTTDNYLNPAQGRRRTVVISSENKAVPKLIGILEPPFKEFRYVVGYLVKHLGEAGYQPMTIHLPGENQRFKIDEPFSIRSLPFDAVIGLSMWYPNVLRWLEELPCPVIMIDHITASNRIIDLVPDERSLCSRVARTLLKKGCGQAFFFDSEDETVNPMRWDAFVAAMGDHSICVDGRLIIPQSTKSKTQQNRITRDVAETIENLKPGTCLFCAHGHAAEEVIKALQKLDLKCPEDHYAIAPGDHFRFPGNIPATGYIVDFGRAAEITVSTLTDILEKKNTSRKRKMLPMELIPGGTL